MIYLSFFLLEYIFWGQVGSVWWLPWYIELPSSGKPPMVRETFVTEMVNEVIGWSMGVQMIFVVSEGAGEVGGILVLIFLVVELESLSAHWLFLGILHTESSCKVSIGILNVECAVRPRGSNRAAIPEDATQMTIAPSLRNLLQRTLYRKFFPVPPWPLRKKSSPRLFSIDSHIFIYACRWSSLRSMQCSSWYARSCSRS